MPSTRAPWRRWRALDDTMQRGFSLVELLVAMMLFGIVLVVVFGLFTGVQRNVSMAGRINDNTRAASNGMNELTRVLRAGTEKPISGEPIAAAAFISASDEEVTLYAYINLNSSVEQPVMVRLSVDADRQLVESRWDGTQAPDGTWAFPSASTAPTSRRILAETVAPASSSRPPLFAYLQADGARVAAPVTGEQLRTIASVAVTLTIQESRGDAKNPVTLQNTVGIPNLTTNRTVS